MASTNTILAKLGNSNGKMSRAEERSNDVSDVLDAPQLTPGDDMANRLAEMLSLSMSQPTPMD